MMKRLLTKQMVALAAIALIAVLCTASAQAQDANDPNNDSLFDPNRVFTLNITMDSGDWRALLRSCNNGLCGPPPHSYWPATLTCGDLGPMLVGIRRKSDLGEPTETKPDKVSLKLDINLYVPGQLFAGKKKLSLECGSEGATVAEGMGYNIYRAAGFVSSRCAWVNVYVNGDYKGIYANVEQVDKRFLADHGLDNDGFLFKRLETGETQRTRELETSPFNFNWYPFDHPDDPNNSEVPAPNDWVEQALWRVNIPHLLTLGAAENFIGNNDAVVRKMTNYFYYDWSTDPNDDPNFQQPRLYFSWDMDSTLKDGSIGWDIIDNAPDSGKMWEGLFEELDEAGVPFAEPTFQADYLTIYQNLMDGPLELSKLLALVDNIQAAIAADVNADPYQQTGSAAWEFQRIRDYLTDRSASVTSQLAALIPPPGTVLLDDDFGGSVWDANWISGHSWVSDASEYYNNLPSAKAPAQSGGIFECNDLDTSDANAVYVKFFIMKDDTETVEDIILSYYNGTSYVDVCDLDLLGADDVWLVFNDKITDSNFFVTNFGIRFNATPENNENVWVDDVIITKTVPMPAIISGTILDPGAAPVAGVSVDANNSGGSDVTDPNGEYSITVDYGWSGTVTPTKTDYTFAPTERVYGNVTSNQSAQDYTGTDICDLYPDGLFDLRDVDVICENWLTVGPDGDINDSGHVDLGDFAILSDKF